MNDPVPRHTSTPIQCNVYLKKCTVYCIYCKLYSLLYIIKTVQCFAHPVNLQFSARSCKLYSVLYIYSVNCTVYPINCTECTVCPVLLVQQWICKVSSSFLRFKLKLTINRFIVVLCKLLSSPLYKQGYPQRMKLYDDL